MPLPSSLRCRPPGGAGALWGLQLRGRRGKQQGPRAGSESSQVIEEISKIEATCTVAHMGTVCGCRGRGDLCACRCCSCSAAAVTAAAAAVSVNAVADVTVVAAGTVTVTVAVLFCLLLLLCSLKLNISLFQWQFLTTSETSRFFPPEPSSTAPAPWAPSWSWCS